MDNKSEIRDFLVSRRAKIRPEDAGLPAGGQRRVAGLRREELAVLAGVSVSYYTRLERGDASGVSESVLVAIARCLKLDDVERAHLSELVRASQGGAREPRKTSTTTTVRPALQQMIDGFTDTPATVQNERGDILAVNALGRALFSEILDGPAQGNHNRYIHFDPRAQDFYRDWEAMANYSVAMLRVSAGKNPYDRALTDLIGELVTRSDSFRRKWAAHNVHEHRAGIKFMHHPVVGDMDLNYETLQIGADDGLRITAYSAEAESTSAENLRLLATWAATPARHESVAAASASSAH